jgi:hypothetical protein
MSTNVSTIASPIAYKLNLKRGIVNALKYVFTSEYPDDWGLLKNLHISLDWPDKPEQYPCIIVNYQETSPLKSAGIGHFEHVLGGPNIYKRWMYQGEMQLTILAESSLARDYISDHVVHLLAFGSTSPYTNVFVPYLDQNLGLDVQLLRESLTPRGESADRGSDWGLIDNMIYSVGYSFGVVGSFTSGIVQNGYIRGVNEATEIV